MLENIHSSFILKYIFSHINQIKYLNIIKNCKKLQKKVNISIEDYKKICKIYLSGNQNGLGQEYSNTEKVLIFEGQFLHWIRNGKGKEYYNSGGVKFEGEYLNGKKEGEGISYHKNGKIKFKGIYKNGKKWTGISYNNLGEKIYEFKNGSGFKKKYDDEGWLLYECPYINQLKNGIKKEYNEDGDILFEGEYVNNELTGKVKKYHKNGQIQFEGEYLNGKKHGKCIKYNDRKVKIFEGEYLNNKRN